jgi:signal transduction histidine kinase
MGQMVQQFNDSWREGTSAAETSAMASLAPAVFCAAQHRLQVGHDIRHELSTITLLASVRTSSKDIGPVSRSRVGQILAETHWLGELIRAYDQTPDGGGRDSQAEDVIRLDLLAADIVRPIRLSSNTRVSLTADAVSARVNRLAFWRALRNIVCNAQEAAGPDGQLAVVISEVKGFAIVEVEDDGPGFDPQRATPSQGLNIRTNGYTRCRCCALTTCPRGSM